MSKSLVPDLTPLSISPSLLLLDPNNPRLHSHKDDRIPEDQYERSEVQKATSDKMLQKRFNVAELIEGIEINGFIPVDHIFVRKYRNSKYFLVLEGNRRVTAVKTIIARIEESREAGQDIDEALANQLSEITVKQINDSGPEDQIREQITYLLGVRHHGSLKKWSSFARAKDIYLKYLALANQTADSFQWDESANGTGEQIARSLSISKKDVELSIRTFVAMSQLANYAPIKKTKHGMLPKWFSLFHDSLNKKNLESYLPRDNQTFQLTEEAVEKYDSLCKFSEPSGKRENAAITNPQEWGKLAQLLNGKDASEAQKQENLRLVEQDSMQPSVVQAKHKQKVNALTWLKWLENMLSITSDIDLSDDTDSIAAKDATSGILKVLDELNTRDTDPTESK